MRRNWVWGLLALLTPFASGCLDGEPASFTVPAPREGDRAVYEYWVEDSASDAALNHEAVFYEVRGTQELEMPWGERWDVARVDYGVPEEPQEATRLYVSLEGNLLVRREFCTAERCLEASVHHPTQFTPWLHGASLLQGRTLRAGQSIDVTTPVGDVRFRVSDVDSPGLGRLWVETDGPSESPIEASFIFEEGQAFPVALTATYRPVAALEGIPERPIVLRNRLQEFEPGDGPGLAIEHRLPERRPCVSRLSSAWAALPPGAESPLPGFRTSMREMLEAGAQYAPNLRERLADADFYVGDLSLSEDERPIVADVGSSRTTTAVIFYDVSGEDWELAVVHKQARQVAPLPPSDSYQFSGQSMQRPARSVEVASGSLARLDDVFARAVGPMGSLHSVRVRLDYGERLEDSRPASMHFDYVFTRKAGDRLVSDVYDSRTGCIQSGRLTAAEWHGPNDWEPGLSPTWV